MIMNSTNELIEDISKGKMVVLLDDEDRENEGDLVLAAEKTTPELINFMATHARGLICLALTMCFYIPGLIYAINDLSCRAKVKVNRKKYDELTLIHSELLKKISQEHIIPNILHQYNGIKNFILRKYRWP